MNQIEGNKVFTVEEMVELVYQFAVEHHRVRVKKDEKKPKARIEKWVKAKLYELNK